MGEITFEARFLGIPEDEVVRITTVLKSYLNVVVGAGLNLDSLEALVVADDYAEGFRSVPDAHGAPGRDNHTNEEFARGVAMAIPVRRPEGWRSTVVLAKSLARTMISEDDSVRRLGSATFVHELAHVADHGEKARMWGPFEASFPLNGAEFYLWGWADRLWSEYRACRVASFIDPEGVVAHAELMAERLKPSQEALIDCLKEYRVSGDLDGLLAAVERHHGFVLKQAAYTIGGLESIGKSLEETSPSSAAALKGSWFEKTYHVLGSELRRLAESYPSWTHPSDMQGLLDALRASFAEVGIVHRSVRGADGRATHKADVPFTDGTLPSPEEEAAIRSRLGI